MSRRAAAEQRREAIISRDFVLVWLSSLTFFGSFYLLLPTLPIYVLRIGGNESEIGLIIGVFTIAAVGSRPFIGREVDARGKKLFLVAGAVIFTISSGLYNLTNTVPLLLLLRIFHGAGIALFLTASSALIADLAPMERRGEAMGYFGTSSNVAMALGPALGIALLQRSDFPTLFLVSAAVALTAVGLTGLISPAEGTAGRTKAVPSALISRRAVYPSALGFCLSFTYGAVVSFLPLYATRQGVSNPGLFFTIYALALIGVRLVAGRISDRYGRAAVLAPGFVCVAVAMAVLIGARSLEVLGVAAVLYGVGFGSVQPASLALIADRVEPGQRGAAMATFGGAFDLGIGLGSILLGVLLQMAGFEALFLAAAASALIGLGLLLARGRAG